MRTFSRLIFGCSLVAVTMASFVGCKDEPAVDVSPAAKTEASAPVPDQVKVCREVCQRATTCGTESLAKSIKGDPTEVALVNKMRSRENETRSKCEATCTADASATGVEASSACLAQETCETFASCIERASEAKVL